MAKPLEELLIQLSAARQETMTKRERRDVAANAFTEADLESKAAEAREDALRRRIDQEIEFASRPDGENENSTAFDNTPMSVHVARKALSPDRAGLDAWLPTIIEYGSGDGV